MSTVATMFRVVQDNSHPVFFANSENKITNSTGISVKFNNTCPILEFTKVKKEAVQCQFFDDAGNNILLWLSRDGFEEAVSLYMDAMTDEQRQKLGRQWGF